MKRKSNLWIISMVLYNNFMYLENFLIKVSTSYYQLTDHAKFGPVDSFGAMSDQRKSHCSSDDTVCCRHRHTQQGGSYQPCTWSCKYNNVYRHGHTQQGGSYQPCTWSYKYNNVYMLWWVMWNITCGCWRTLATDTNNEKYSPVKKWLSSSFNENMYLGPRNDHFYSYTLKGQWKSNVLQTLFLA